MPTNHECSLLPAIFFVIAAITIITLGPFGSIYSNVSATTSGDIFIVSSNSGAEVKTMELRAINENGEVRMVSDFSISTENVVSVEQNGRVTVFSAPTSPTFTSAKITDANDVTDEIPVSDKGVISLTGYDEGVYTLDVIVDDKFAFECLLVIGEEQQQIINRQITEVNQRTDDPWKKGIDKVRVCLFTPSHPVCKPDKNGKCPPGWAMNENGNCYPAYKQCPPGYWRADEDETGACVPLPKIPFIPWGTNGTLVGNNTDEFIANVTNATTPDLRAINLTQSDDDGSGGEANQTLAPGPILECPEGEALTLDGLSCDPVITGEPAPITCGEGEEFVGGQCQVVPAEEDTALDGIEEGSQPQNEEEEDVGEIGEDDRNEASGDQNADTDEDVEIFG